MIEARAGIFAQRLRDRHLIFPAGSDLARTLLAKYAAFNRERTDFPVLTYHQLAGPTSESAEIDQNGVDLKSQGGSAQFTFANGAAPLPVMRPARLMIQRRSLSSGPPASGGFPTKETQAIPRSPILSEAGPFKGSTAPISLSSAGRLSAFAATRETTPSGAPARTAQVVFLRPPPASLGTPRAPLTPPESKDPSSTASVGWPAESGKRLPALFLSHQPAAAVAQQVGGGEMGEPASRRTGSALPPILGAMPVVKSSVTRPGWVSSARPARAQSSIRFASSWSPSENRVHALPVEAFHSEFRWRDIRMNPLGRSPLEKQIASAAALPAPSLDLTLHLPTPPGVPAAAAPGRSFAEGEEVAAKSMTSDMRPAAGPQVPTLTEVADRVYRLLERRLVVERERRGVFRS